MKNKKYYVTTPIYYPSSDLHIGHTYTTVAADTINRFRKLQGYDSYFITGTDEHGQKIQTIAEETGIDSQAYVDNVVSRIKRLWEVMNVKYDQFIRTTDPQHMKTIQHIFRKLYEQGDIYKGRYEGLYCTPCESFWTRTQAQEGICPDCGRPLTQTSEEAYFFRITKYADRLLQHIEEHPEFIQPESRKNEMINNFIKPGLQDLCVSRTSFTWGVPVDFDPKHVVYVWIDALPNYLSALGYLNDKEDLMGRYWAPDLQLVGKDIIRFHTIYWPIMLMALDLPLPKTVYGHGWIMLKEGKMSKSFGNVVDPIELADKYSVDALRYYILREMNFGGDSVYNEELLVNRINSDLANDLGNLLHRTTAMTIKYFKGVLPEKRETDSLDEGLEKLALQTPQIVSDWMEKADLSRALEAIWRLVTRTNKYIDENQPWVLCKKEEKKSRLAQVMYYLKESLRTIGILSGPFMPETGTKILDVLKVPDDYRTWNSLSLFGRCHYLEPMEKTSPLFPRIETDKKNRKEKKEGTKKTDQNREVSSTDSEEGLITIDDFSKVQLRIGEVISCEKHPKADKLLVFRVNLGEKTRQIISGIAKYYKPEELVGKKVIVCVNLKPVKLRGLESDGMILSALEKDKLSLITLDRDIIEPGSEVR